MSVTGNRQINVLWFKLFLVVCVSQAILVLFFAWFYKHEASMKIKRLPEPIKVNLKPIKVNLKPIKVNLEPIKVDLEQSSTRTTLFVAILTHSKRKERRDAIRETWMTLCLVNPTAMFCRFFTDQVGLNDEARKDLQHEKEQHNDIEILNATDSFAFAERLLLIWEWAKNRSLRYDYFLRIDDDHFLCVDRMIHELRHRPIKGLYWGFVHCQRRVVRVDEAWMLLSQDLVAEIMVRRENRTLLCSPYGDQAVAMWINLSKQNITYFMDNDRIVHKSAGRNPVFFKTNLCEKYLSLHGTYPRAMKQFWILSQILRKKLPQNITYEVPAIANLSKLCSFSPRFDYKGFIMEYQFQPKLCHLHPKWRISQVLHGGREEEGERYTNY